MPIVFVDLVVNVDVVVQQRTGFDAGDDVGQQTDFAFAHALGNVEGCYVLRVLQAGRLDHFFQRFQGLLVVLVDAFGFVGHDKGLLAVRVLRRYTGGQLPVWQVCA